LLVLLAIAGMGGLIDVAGGSSLTGWFNVALIIASAVAILIVRHSNMFTIVVAPPLVYFLASGGMIYIRSHGLHNHKILRDDAINLLVYGFPAIAGATAAVLIVAGCSSAAKWPRQDAEPTAGR
jgi:fumarate reductase subunit D